MSDLLFPLFIIALGIVVLVAGAEFFVRGAVKLAKLIGISPLVIGLTVVAYGTSMPELAVSAQSSLAGLNGLAVGNVVGSNIANILLILGLSALVAPLIVSQQLVRLDVPLMIGASMLVIFFSLDGALNTLEGLILFGLLIVYTVFVIYKSRQEAKPEVVAEYAEEYGAKVAPTWQNIALIVVQLLGGLGGLVLGAGWLVDGASTIATTLGISELVVGLTVVAVGTSLPELATSVVASIRGERDIAVGNVVGSNLFNLLMVLGLSAVVSPTNIIVSEQMLTFDMPIMLLVAIACLPIFFTGVIPRWAGGMFVAYYIVYTSYLVLVATENHAIAEQVSLVVLYLALPLTGIWLVYVAWQAWRQRQLAA
jgi:cation:H+ antiporter